MVDLSIAILTLPEGKSHFPLVFLFLLLKTENNLRSQDMLLMNPPPLPDATSAAGSGSGSGDLDDEVAQLVGMGFETSSARGWADGRCRGQGL